MLSAIKNLNELNRRNFLIWCSLAFQAGAINAGGFLACHRFVSHITGFATHFGAEVALGHMETAWGILSVPLFFLIGSMISAFFIDGRIFVGKTPHYRGVITAIGIILSMVSTLGMLGKFGEFGTPLSLNVDYGLLAMLCLACGMQNASVTSASGAVVRTTHLTGMTTDLGIGLMRVFSRCTKDPEKTSARKASESRKNHIRMGLIGSYILGSLVGSLLFVHYGYLGFMLPALISLGLSGFGAFKEKHPDQEGMAQLG